jgi:hypothetical protein
MEKRWCERTPVSINVMIHHNGNKLAKCAVKNISLCGISLNSGPLAFYRNTEIQLKFLDAGYLPGDKDYINAVVVRNAPEEIGLMFAPTEPEMLSFIIRHFRKYKREVTAISQQ